MVYQEACLEMLAKKEAYGYQELANALREAYASVGISLGGNKVVSLITTLKNKRMIEQKHGKKYSFLCPTFTIETPTSPSLYFTSVCLYIRTKAK